MLDRSRVVLFALGVAVATGCGSTGPARVAASLRVQPAALTLFTKASDTLVATAYDAGDTVIPNANISFSSSDPTVATVSGTGVVTGVALGSTNILAKSDTALAVATVTVSNTDLGTPIAVSGGSYGVAVSSKGVVYATLWNTGDVARLDSADLGVVAKFHTGGMPTSITFNQAGTRAYVGDQSGTFVRVADVATNAIVDSIDIGQAQLAVAVPQGDSLLVVSESSAGQADVVNLSSHKIVHTVYLSAPSNNFAVHGTHVYAGSPFGGVVTEFDATTGQTLRNLTTGGAPQGLVVSSDESTLYVANEIGQLQAWSLANGTELGSVSLQTGSPGGGFGLAQNPANGLFYVTTSYYGSNINVVDPTTMTVVGVINVGATPRRIVFTPGAGAAIATNEGGWVNVIR